jgi:tripartite-type tricarboxylate transporter receptor subunit TctC
LVNEPAKLYYKHNSLDDIGSSHKGYLMHRFTSWIAAFMALMPIVAFADFPEKPIRFIVPYAAGGGTDLVARMVAVKMATLLKQPVLIENKPGASSNIGTEFVARAPADGYTVLVTAPNFSTSEALFPKLGWRTEDFAPVIQLTRHSNVLVAGPGTPVGNLRELIAAAKKSPGTIYFGSPGLASAAHLAMELLKIKTDMPVNHVAYKGSAPLKTDLLGGHIQLGVDGLSGQMEIIKSGKVRPLAILGPKRSIFAPDIPSLADFGISDVDGTGWYGALVPVTTPPVVVAKLHDAFQSVLNDAEIREQLNALGVEPAGESSQQFKQFLLSERDKWAKVISIAKIKVE